MKKLYMFIIFTIPLVLGCAYTQIDSQINPYYNNLNMNYTSFLVVANFGDLKLERSLEEKTCESLNKYDVRCYASSDLIFRGSSYTKDEIENIIKRKNIDAILIITDTYAGVNVSYLPSYTTTKTIGTFKEGYLGQHSFRSTSKTTTKGGQAVIMPKMNFIATLFDTYSKENVWMATAQTGGGIGSDFENVVRSMGGKTVVKLNQDGLIGE